METNKDIQLIKGDLFKDYRGLLYYNNNLDISDVKRLYIIENENIGIVRAWQGHRIERRWFSVLYGRFKIKLVKIDCWEFPSDHLIVEERILNNILETILIPPGYVTSIQSLEKKSKLLVMSDYQMNEIDDDYKFETSKWI